MGYNYFLCPWTRLSGCYFFYLRGSRGHGTSLLRYRSYCLVWRCGTHKRLNVSFTRPASLINVSVVILEKSKKWLVSSNTLWANKILRNVNLILIWVSVSYFATALKMCGMYFHGCVCVCVCVCRLRIWALKSECSEIFQLYIQGMFRSMGKIVCIPHTLKDAYFVTI